MTCILLADDHAVVRAGYRKFLESAGPYTLGEASTAAQVFEQMRRTAWDLLLLDISLPDKAGLVILKDLRSEFPATRILVVSALPEVQYATEVLRQGAAGFLRKEAAGGDLIKAVQRVLSGQRYISTAVAEQMVNDLGKPQGPRHEQLSSREREVFDRIATGTSVTMIAEELGLSVKTVSTYRARVLEKMRLESNADITSYALRHGLSVIHGKSQDAHPH